MFPTASRLAHFQQTVRDDLNLFLPELVVCGGIVLLLLCRLVKWFDRAHLGGLAAGVVAAALAVAVMNLADGLNAKPVSYFSVLLVGDAFGGYVRVLILAAALLTIVLTKLTRIPDADDSADFYVLLLGGTLGMLLMTSANHLLMVFIAVEMASLPSYALAGFLKGRKQGSEAALKYVVYGAAASGVMLYGISLIAGTFGTGHLGDIATGTARRVAANGGFDLTLVAGFALLLAGLGFKLAVVPFHFWCPDVFEGAAAEVAGFLSVASKAAAVALTTRVLLTLHQSQPDPWLVPRTLGLAVGVVAAITVTFGNLAAFGQTNLKRLLAYSTVAHAGYMLLAVSVCSPQATSAVLYYLAAYLLMNLGAFAVVAVVRNRTGSEELDAYRGLVKRSPVLAVSLSLFLLGLLGLPPLAGFAGKFQVFAALYDGSKAAATGGHAGLGNALFVLLAVAAINTAVSAYFYLKVVRAMVLDDGDAAPVRAGGGAVLVGVLAALLVALGVIWNPLVSVCDRAAVVVGGVK